MEKLTFNKSGQWDLKKDDTDKNIKIEAALERQGKKTTIPHEEYQALKQWWDDNKHTALTPEQSKMLSSIKETKKRRSGIKLAKD